MKLLIGGSFLWSVGIVSLFGATITSNDRYKTDYTTSWTAGSSQTYTISASASGCSFVESRTVAGGGANLTGSSSSSASADKAITHTETPNTSGFGFSVSGVLAGSGDGPEVTWSATLQQRFFWLTASPAIIVKVGTAVTITANGDPTESTWSINGQSWKDHNNASSQPYKRSSVTLNRDMWDKLQLTPSPVPTGYLFPPAGIYSISAPLQKRICQDLREYPLKLSMQESVRLIYLAMFRKVTTRLHMFTGILTMITVQQVEQPNIQEVII